GAGDGVAIEVDLDLGHGRPSVSFQGLFGAQSDELYTRRWEVIDGARARRRTAAVPDRPPPHRVRDDTEPEPDVTVLRNRSYKDAEPDVADVLLLIEVAETSLRYDRVTKQPLYAEAGVPEYWIVDCGAESIELHRTPAAGGYRDVTRVTGAAESVSLLAFSDVSLGLAEIFS